MLQWSFVSFAADGNGEGPSCGCSPGRVDNDFEEKLLGVAIGQTGTVREDVNAGPVLGHQFVGTAAVGFGVGTGTVAGTCGSTSSFFSVMSSTMSEANQPIMKAGRNDDIPPRTGLLLDHRPFPQQSLSCIVQPRYIVKE